MGMYRDRNRAEGALVRLREHFPHARVIVRSDGDSDPENHDLGERFGVDYREESRLYPIENGGSMVARMFELFLEQHTRYLIKIDTDTAVYRRFHSLPEQFGVFGSRQKSKLGCYSIQGGCTGFPEACCRSIFESGILEDPRLRDPVSHRDESLYFMQMAKRARRTGLCGFEWIIAWAAEELQIPLFSFSEVRSKWRADERFNNNNLKFAIIHPEVFSN